MKFNFLVSGYAIADEILNRSVSTALKLGHDLFIGTGLEIWTAPGGTGTQLAITTDYVLNGTDSVYTTKVGETVYTKLAIVNGAYQNVDLYITYTTVGDYSSVENVSALASDKFDEKIVLVATLPTADQKAALAGTSGTPSDTNRYVTNDDVRLETVFANYQGVPSASFLTPASLVEDTHSSMNASNEWIVPINGLYTISVGTTATVSGAAVTDPKIVVNGTTVAHAYNFGPSGYSTGSSVTRTLRLLAGDKVKFGLSGASVVTYGTVVKVGV